MKASFVNALDEVAGAATERRRGSYERLGGSLSYRHGISEATAGSARRKPGLLPLELRFSFVGERRKRFYRLTPAGRKFLIEEVESWKRYAAAVNQINNGSDAFGRVGNAPSSRRFGLVICWTSATVRRNWPTPSS